jgi:hypothetical protein
LGNNSAHCIGRETPYFETAKLRPEPLGAAPGAS